MCGGRETTPRKWHNVASIKRLRIRYEGEFRMSKQADGNSFGISGRVRQTLDEYSAEEF